MKVLRYILSHAILLGFIVLLVLAYQYRHQLFPEQVTAFIDSQTDRVVQLVSRQRETTAPQPASQGEAAITTPLPVTDSADVKEATSEPQNVTEVQVTQAMPVATTPASDPVAPVTQAEPDTTATVTTELAPVQAENDRQAAAPSQLQLLDQARLAFHDGKIDQAIHAYEQLSDLDPNNADAFGELGNVYYTQGNWQKAGVAYYEAATRLLAMGDTAQVQYLYRVIQGLDQESANKLAQKLGM